MYFRSYILSFFLLLAALSATAGPVILSGQVDQTLKLDPAVFRDKSLSVLYYDVFGNQDRITSNFDGSGKFSLNFSILYPQVIVIQAGSGYFCETLAIPGDKISMLLKYELRNKSVEGYPTAHYEPDFERSFLGPRAAMQASFTNFRIKLHAVMKSNFDSKQVSDRAVFTDLQRQIPAWCDELFSSSEVFDPALKAYALNEMNFNLIYQFLSSTDEAAATDYKEIRFPKLEYLSTNIINAIRTAKRIPEVIARKHQEASYLQNPNYTFSGEQRSIIIKAISGTLDPSDSVKVETLSEEVKKNIRGMASADSVITDSECKFYTDYLPSDIADMICSEKIIALKSDPNNSFEYAHFLTFIKSSQLRTSLGRELKNSSHSKYTDYVKKTDNDIISAIIKEFPGKSIYVDLWATWCGPCRSEFKFYPNLIDHYRDKVVFVLMCASSREQEYKDMISKLPFKVHHYFLSPQQYSQLANDFKVVGFPHYMMVTKAGKVINNFKRPSALESLQADIDREL